MELKRLGDYVKIKTGKLDANASSENGKYPFFTCAVNNLWIDNYAYDCECVLIAGNGDLNVKYYEGKFNAYQRTYVVESIDKSILDIRYLYYFMNKYIDVLRNNSIGGVIKYIKLGDLTEAIIPLPPLEIQKKIIEVSDKAQALIDARKEQIRLMDALIQSVFYEMFGDPMTNPKGWEVKKLSELIETQPQNGMYKPQSEYVKNGFGTPILRIDAFYNGKVENWDLKRLNCTDEELAKYGLNIDDIVINRVNSIDYLGKCAHIDKLKEPTVFESNMMRFSVKKMEINSFYLIKLLSHKYIYNQILVCAKKAVNQASINQQDVKSLDIVVPNIDLQNAFTFKVREIERRKKYLLESHKLMEKNSKSIMNLAFNGELN